MSKKTKIMVGFLVTITILSSVFTVTAFAKTKKESFDEYIPNDKNTHTKITETWEYNVDKNGELTSGKPYGSTEKEEEHTFDENGICIYCGCDTEGNIPKVAPGGSVISSPAIPSPYTGKITVYEKTKDDSNETIQDKNGTIRVTEIPDEEIRHGVSPSKKTGITETLETIANNVSNLKIINATAIFDEKTAKELDKLSTKDQIDVLLIAMGYKPTTEPSDIGKNLADAIVSEMTIEGILKKFPTEILTIDNNDVPCYIIEFEIDNKIECYAFRKDNNTFVKLFVEK